MIESEVGAIVVFALCEVHTIVRKKMFCDISDETCNKLLSSADFQSLSSKRERIRYVLQRFDLNLLVRTATKRVLAFSRLQRKSLDVAHVALRSAEMLVAVNATSTTERIKKISANASKVGSSSGSKNCLSYICTFAGTLACTLWFSSVCECSSTALHLQSSAVRIRGSFE